MLSQPLSVISPHAGCGGPSRICLISIWTHFLVDSFYLLLQFYCVIRLNPPPFCQVQPQGILGPRPCGVTEKEMTLDASNPNIKGHRQNAGYSRRAMVYCCNKRNLVLLYVLWKRPSGRCCSLNGPFKLHFIFRTTVQLCSSGVRWIEEEGQSGLPVAFISHWTMATDRNIEGKSDG